MRRPSKQQSFFWLWWRRKSFYLRTRPLKWFIVLVFAISFIIIISPNPFSSDYDKISLNQEIQWDSVAEILQLKEQILSNDLVSKQTKVIKHGSEEKSTSKQIIILLYTTIFLYKKNCRTEAERIFGKTCPSKNRCKWICDNRKLKEADAIIFHAYDMQFYPDSLPQRSDTKPDSIWILWSDEPHTIVDYVLFNSLKFNWTISFKMNSEVSIGSYGLFTKREFSRSTSDYNLWIDSQFRERSNGALWFVSNCNARERLDIYYKLRKEVNTSVEGYGRCVDYYPMHFCSAGSQCEKDYMSKFKYYLSFESMTCRDYITEKFYKAFYHGLIPIVYGPDRKDYEHFAPPNSFIHINDFNKDMNKLANYLQEIHSNFTLYSMYHQWRKTHDIVIDGKAVERIRMCELCERLTKVRHGDITYYNDIDLFYHEKC
ncbi:unnamed protein product [Adineta steineri]|uniref:Fucosyltransferase n=1 Tax=Adineta steineri TaxID=433720 RepID=A0A819BWK8_9BILA|nr:unnamed protein product [Adineta steineri]CAF3801448.1 unnamed protein product [Adineta steineri]